MSTISNLLKISKAVDNSEVWRNRVQTAFDMADVPMTRALFVNVTAIVADDLAFFTVVTETFDEESGDSTIVETVDTMGSIDCSDVNDEAIFEAITTVLNESNIERQTKQNIEELEDRVATLEGEKVNLETTLNLYKQSIAYYEQAEHIETPEAEQESFNFAQLQAD